MSREQLNLFEAPVVDRRPVAADSPTPTRPRRPPETPTVALACRLTPLVGESISVVLTNNRSRIFSARLDGDTLAIRLHRSFAAAPDRVLRAIAELARRRPGTPVPREALATIRAHHARETPPPEPRAVLLHPVGDTLDLRVLRDEINRSCFAGALDVAITWGAPPRRGRVPRSIRLGSYDPRSRIVRIHRALDAPDVPRYVVAAIVHHELLHASMPPEGCDAGGRRVVHSAAFRSRERAYEHHARSEAWIQAHLPRLLRRATSKARRSSRGRRRGR